jgi:hypothetical protein
MEDTAFSFSCLPYAIIYEFFREMCNENTQYSYIILLSIVL